MFKELLILGMFCLCLDIYGADADSQLLKAYTEQRWSKLKNLLSATEPSAQQRLIQALYYLYAPRGDKNKGLELLNLLREDKKVPESIRRQAILTYARNVELMQMRPDLYPDAASIAEPSEMYAEIIEKYPASKEACYAVIYKSREVFNFPKSSEEEISQAFAEVEKFLAKPESRNQNFLGIIHWYLANEYIVIRREYKLAVRHLVAAEKYGISNPRFLSDIRFQIGRIYDSKLHDRQNAIKYYQAFIKQYPSSLKAKAARRYMKKLGEGK